MEKLNERVRFKWENAIKAYKALERSISTLKETIPSTGSYNTIVAGTIKHFEMSFEATCKLLQAILRVKKIIVSGNPDIIRQCYKANIITEEMADSLLELLDDRNNTVHVYNESQANEVCQNIESHYKMIGIVLKHINAISKQ